MRKFGHLLLIPLLALFVSHLAVAQGPSSLCQLATLKPTIHWLSSATWISTLEKLAVVDPLNKAVYLISEKGVSSRPDVDLAGPGSRPTAISAAGSGFLLKLAGPHFRKLDPFLKPGDTLDIQALSQGPTGAIGSLYDWTTTEDALVAYGSIRNSSRDSGSFRLAFFRAPLSNLANIQIVQDMGEGDPYLVGNSYFTGIGKDAYFVAFGKKPSIVHVDASGKVQTLTSFPATFRKTPRLDPTKMEGPATEAEIYADLEKETMPAGLVSQGDRLFLLTRKPNPELKGATIWTLFRIDPAKDSIEAEIVLPTSSSQVTLASAPNWFYLFERGKVDSEGAQDIQEIVLLKTSYLATVNGQVGMRRDCTRLD